MNSKRIFEKVASYVVGTLVMVWLAIISPRKLYRLFHAHFVYTNIRYSDYRANLIRCYFHEHKLEHLLICDEELAISKHYKYYDAIPTVALCFKTEEDYVMFKLSYGVEHLHDYLYRKSS